MEETVQGLKVHLLSSNHDSAQENQWEVPFDPSLKEVTVSLSGPAPQIELRDPLGTLCFHYVFSLKIYQIMLSLLENNTIYPFSRTSNAISHFEITLLCVSIA